MILGSKGLEGSRELAVVDFAVDKGVIDNVIDENATDGGNQDGKLNIVEDIL